MTGPRRTHGIPARRRRVLFAMAIAPLLLAAPVAAPAQGADATRQRAERILLTPVPASNALDWAERVLAQEDPSVALPLVARVFEKGTWESRRAVARALAAIDHAERDRWLAKAARDLNWNVRAAALRSAVLAGADGAPALLARAATDPVWSVRWAAIRGLAALPGPGILRDAAPDPAGGRPDPATLLFIRALDDGDEEVRREAVRALCRRPTLAAIPTYTRIVADPDAKVAERLAAGRALLRLARTLTETPPGGQRAALTATVTALRESPDGNARVIGLRLAQSAGLGAGVAEVDADTAARIVADVLTTWSTADPALRAVAEAAAEALAPKNAPETGTIALDLLIAEPTHPAIRSEEIIAWIVRRIDGANALSSLVDRLDSPRPSPALRTALVRALPALGVRGPRDFLLRTYRQEHRRAIAVADAGKPDARRAWRSECFAALAATAPFEGWGDVVAIALDDPAPSIRQRAAEQWIETAGVEQPYDRLVKSLATHTSDHFGRNFLRTVARRRDEAAFTFLIALAQGTYTDRAKLRFQGLNALTATTWEPAYTERLVRWIRLRLQTEKDDSGRVRMLRMLYNLERDDALPLLAKTALDSNEREIVRRHAIDRLGYSGRASAAPPLRKLLDDPKTPPPLRRAALKRLLTLAQPEDAARMIAVLPHGNEQLRLVALVALEKTKPRTALAAVRKLIDNGLVEPQNRARGLRVFAAIAGEAAADDLFRRMRGERLTEMRVGALDALSLLPPRAYVDRLLAYLAELRRTRKENAAADRRFAELIGELGRTTSEAVTRFLIDFLLEDASIPDQPAPLENRRERILIVNARTALLGHNPRRVRGLLRESIDAYVANGAGLGIREAFYADLVRTFSHPSRWRSWGPVAIDLVERLDRTAPHGSRRDYAALQVKGNALLQRAAFEEAAALFARLHRIAALEDYPNRLQPAPSLTDDAIERLRVIAEIAAGASAEDREAGWAMIRRAVAELPDDAETVLLAAEAAAAEGRDLDWAAAKLARISRRLRGSRSAAETRFALGCAFLQAERPSEATKQFRVALRDRKDLRDRFAADPLIREKLPAPERRALLDLTR